MRFSLATLVIGGADPADPDRRRKRSSTMSAREDFLHDWHRWTAAERVSAALLGTVAAISLPAAILLNLHLG
jgi:hypothetical protein